MATKNVNDTIDENLSRQEEEHHLSEIETKIDKEIDGKNNSVRDLTEKIDSMYAIGKGEREGKLELIRWRNEEQQSIEQWKRYKDCPYFGHIDLRCDNQKTNTFFVGEKGIPVNQEALVLDWRSPIGGLFYNKQSNEYTVKGKEYHLVLRRSVDIKNAKVINVRTEYDEGMTLNGEIIDPFLLSVLRDKRRNYRLTDIIRTIQENQNDLIRKGDRESFIVQGCAGSGKTMILLHRLTYILYHNPHFDFSRCFILTPNENFNLHIDELVKKLNINQIKRFTVEKYYVDRIMYLGRNDVHVVGNGRKKLKVEPVSENVASEKLLNPDMLREIYSRSFFDAVCSLYDSTWKEVLGQVDHSGAKRILFEIGAPLPESITYGYSSFYKLKKSLSDALAKHNDAKARYENLLKGFSSVEQDVLELRSSLKEANESTDRAKVALLSDLDASKKENETALRTAKALAEKNVPLINAAKVEREKANESLKTLRESLSVIENKKDLLSSLGFLHDSDTEIARIILTRCADTIRMMEIAEKQYQEAPFYNFGKKSRAKAEMVKASEDLSQAVDRITEEYSAFCVSEIAVYEKKIDELEARIAEATDALMPEKEKEERERKLNVIIKCEDVFGLSETPNLEKAFLPAEIDDLPNSASAYLLSYKLSSENAKDLQATERRYNDTLAAAEKYKKDILRSEYAETLAMALVQIERLDFEALYDEVVCALNALFDKYGQKTNKKPIYRHDLLYKLLLCSLYYGGDTGGPYYMNIDEAQDLAEIEYTLLRRMLGRETVFNLYGDVNQLVYSFKGISGWEDIAEDITPNVCYLNENYRNTIQITDFCNREFEADIVSIGLSGSDVRRLSFGESIKELLRLKADDPGRRTAIIYRKGLSKLKDALEDFGNKWAFDTVTPNKTSVITVEESKGLEFDAVVAIDSHMTVNEKYVAYTRALDNLIITNLPEAEIMTDEETDGISSDETTQSEIMLTNDGVNVPIPDAGQYIDAFFGADSESKDLFKAMLDVISEQTPDVVVRVTKQYIGTAYPNEKCRVYIARENGRLFIKFRQSKAKDSFVPERLNGFGESYLQCCRYCERFPESVKMKQNSK